MTRVFLVLLLLVVGAGLTAGFLVVGGPKQARMEKADRERVNDLRRLGRYYRCQDLDGDTGTRTEQTGCAVQTTKPEVVDPVTGAAYIFRRVAADTFEICATFQTDISAQGSPVRAEDIVLSGQEGCLRYQRREADGIWRLIQGEAPRLQKA